MTIRELAERYTEKPTEARYEALTEEIFKREATAKGIIWYSILEEVNPVFCDNYKCAECPIGHDICDKASKGQVELEKALKKALENMGFEVSAYYDLPSREEVREAIKNHKLKNEQEDKTE